MCRHNEFQQGVFASIQYRLEIACESRLEWLLLLPFRVQGCKRLDAIEGEGKLEIHRLFGPQSAVVIEHGNALRGWNETWTSGGTYFLYKPEDGLFARTLIPGRQWISLPGCRHASESQHKAEDEAQSR